MTAEIVASSITTGDEKRDEHLRSADFFDTDVYPVISFTSDKVLRDGTDLRVIGRLTIRDITKDVELAVEQLGTAIDPWGNQRVAFSARATLDRKDFDLTWNQVLEAGGLLVGDKVELTLDLQAVRVAALSVAA